MMRSASVRKIFSKKILRRSNEEEGNPLLFLWDLDVWRLNPFFVKFLFKSNFLFLQHVSISRPPSNFYFCQILRPATKPAISAGLKTATKPATNKIWHTTSLYLYFPFYYNTNFKINQATKAVKFSRANLKRFKLWFLIKIKLYYI